MPYQSQRQELHNILDQAELALARSRYEHAIQDITDSDSMDTSSSGSLSDLDMMVITPPSPVTPLMGNISDISDLSSVAATRLTASRLWQPRLFPYSAGSVPSRSQPTAASAQLRFPTGLKPKQAWRATPNVWECG